MQRTLYLITCVLNQKKYVGQTKDYKRRIRAHIRGSKRVSLISNAIKKHGVENFIFEKIAIVEKHMADEAEKKAIKVFNTLKPNGYNIETGGNSCKELSIETKQKLSKARIGKPSPMKGKQLNLTPEQRQALADRNIGKIISEEQKAKTSATLKERYSKLTREERQEKAKVSFAGVKPKPKKERKPRVKKPSKLIINGVDTRKIIWSEETKQRRIEGLKRYHANMTPEEKMAYANKARARKLKPGKTGYIGVCQKKGETRFRASISYNNSMHHIGIYDTAIEAAHAYDTKAKELFGEYANLNFKI